MGFLDKAKKMAEQAQTKLDDVQKQFNESQGAAQQTAAGGEGGVPVEYDKHGRPVPASPEAAAPPPPPAPEAAAPPLLPPQAPPAPQLERDDEYAPPKLSSGDPLEG